MWWHQAKYNKKPHPQATPIAHSLKTVKGIPKPVCKRCGLVALNNPATRYFLGRTCWKYPDE